MSKGYMDRSSRMKALRIKKTKPNAAILLEQEDEGTCQEKKNEGNNRLLECLNMLRRDTLGIKIVVST